MDVPLPPIPAPELSPATQVAIIALAVAILVAVRLIKRREKGSDLYILVLDDVVRLLPARRVANVLVASDDNQVIFVPVAPQVKAYKWQDGGVVYPVLVAGELGFPGNPEDFLAMSVLSLADDTDNVDEFIRNVAEIVSKHIDIPVAGVKVALPFSLSKSMKQYISFNIRNVADAFAAMRALSENMEHLKQVAEAAEKIAKARERTLTAIALLIVVAGMVAAIVMSVVR